MTQKDLVLVEYTTASMAIRLIASKYQLVLPRNDQRERLESKHHDIDEARGSEP